jgi:hypothetical protein
MQPRRSLIKEAFAPLAHDLPRDRKARPDLVVGQAIRSKQDNLGPNDGIIRRRIFARLRLQLTAFATGEKNREWTRAWHRLEERSMVRAKNCGCKKYVIVFMAVRT